MLSYNISHELQYLATPSAHKTSVIPPWERTSTAPLCYLYGPSTAFQTNVKTPGGWHHNYSIISPINIVSSSHTVGSASGDHSPP